MRTECIIGEMYQLYPNFLYIFFLVAVLGSYLLLYKVTDATPLCWCWLNIGLVEYWSPSTLAQRCLLCGSMLVFSGMNVTLLCKNIGFFLIASIIFRSDI